MEATRRSGGSDESNVEDTTAVTARTGEKAMMTATPAHAEHLQRRQPEKSVTWTGRLQRGASPIRQGER